MCSEVLLLPECCVSPPCELMEIPILQRGVRLTEGMASHSMSVSLRNLCGGSVAVGHFAPAGTGYGGWGWEKLQKDREVGQFASSTLGQRSNKEETTPTCLGACPLVLRSCVPVM